MSWRGETLGQVKLCLIPALVYAAERKLEAKWKFTS
jgi:hypothetical protein